MNTNSENPNVGKSFEKISQKWAEKYFGQSFNEKSVGIGNPSVGHKFDLVSSDEKIIIECKCYTWTVSGNVPSAKLATLDEAILYLSNVHKTAQKIIAMKRDWSEKKKKTLAEYFIEKKGHLMRDISVVEIDENGDYRFVRNVMRE